MANIDTYTDNVISNLEFPVGQHPKNLVSNRSGDKLYYLNGTIYSFSTSNASLDSIPFVNKYFYGLGCDGLNVYGTDAMDYVQSGWSYKYDRYGNTLDSNQVGIIPGGYCFN